MSRFTTRYFFAGVTIAGVLFTAHSTASGQNAAAAEGEQMIPAAPLKMELPADPTSDNLVNFLADMITYVPQTEEQLKEFQASGPKLMDSAARQVLQLETDRNSDNFRFAAKYLLAVESMNVAKLPETRQQELLSIIAGQLAGPHMDSDDLDIAVTFAEGLEIAGKTELATKAYNDFSKALAGSQDALALELSKLMAGAGRRLTLLGSAIQVAGTTIDGETFDWSHYRGKVVLIDFWATWCGPCMQEMPNIRKAYESYADRGFEVVAISMDEDRAKLEEFLKANPMPWSVLHEGKGGTNPTAIHYGISALPTSILVDRTGKVVSMDARGKELEQLLAELLANDVAARRGNQN